MSTALTCQDLSFVGGQRYNCPYPASTSLDSVDVSRETLASFWSAGPLEETSCQREPPQHEASSSSNWPDPAWMDQLSPHLQRNKQLQDTLIQREEELARLHEENHKLKEFLSSSFVKDLEEKKMKLLSALSVDGRKHRKRSLLADPKGFQSLRTSQLLQGMDGKRTCRNLSLEFCSEEELASTPPVDHWILQTLGLTDIDTIDTSAEYSFHSSYRSMASPGPDLAPTAHNYCQPASQEPTYPFNYASSTGCDVSAEPVKDCRSNFSLDVTTAGATVEFSPETTVISQYQANPSPLAKRPQSPENPYPFALPSAPITPQVWGSGRHHTPNQHCQTPISPSDPPPRTPSTPRGRTEVAFSMSLSPSSSVKTHSFAQGQAFVRRDTLGRWNFTWVPKQDP